MVSRDLPDSRGDRSLCRKLPPVDPASLVGGMQAWGRPEVGRKPCWLGWLERIRGLGVEWLHMGSMS